LALTLALSIFAALPEHVAMAAITLDGTLGTSGGLRGPHFLIPAGVGQTVGRNLFHSFGVFDVDTGESATFSGPGSIRNVIGRVTDGHETRVDGPLRSTIAGANVFMLNPAGFVLGPNATLEIEGSFHVSSADYLRLGRGGLFSASHPESSNLTAAAPSAFGFLGGNAAITLDGAKLEVPTGRTISVTSSDVTGHEATLAAPNGQVLMGAVAGSGELEIGARDLEPVSVSEFGEILLSSDSRVSTSGNPGGPVVIRAGRLVLEASGIDSDAGGGENGLGVHITVTDEVELDDNSEIRSHSTGSGAAGDIEIEAGEVALRRESSIASSAFDEGRGGRIRIASAGPVRLAGGSSITTESYSTGSGGSLSVAAHRLSLTGRSDVSSSVFGEGSSGTISLTTRREVVVSDGSGIFSDTEGRGDASTLLIRAPTLRLHGAELNAGTSGAGNGGVIRVDVEHLLMDSGATIDSGTTGPGDAGEVAISTQRLDMRAGAAINSITLDRGDAGPIEIRAASIEMSGGSEIDSSTLGAGDGGPISISTSTLHLEGAANLASGTFDAGKGGSIAIEASRSVELLTGAGLFSDSESSGDGGTIELRAGTLVLRDGAVISTESSGAGLAGDLRVELVETIRLERDSLLTTEARRSDGGNIRVDARELVYLLDSAITATVDSGVGDGGNITIDPQFVVLNDGDIIANAFGGRGGNIKISAGHLIATPASSISASSARSIDGTVVIDAPENLLTGDIASLPGEFLDVSRLLGNHCDKSGDRSSLTLGTPTPLTFGSDDYLPGFNPRVAEVSLPRAAVRPELRGHGMRALQGWCGPGIR
jgi:filamentous hemagglutinin family protein